MKLQPFLIAALLLPACALPALGATTTGGYSITAINAPNATETYPTAINTAGQIVGYFYDSSATLHGFLYQSGVFTSITCNGQSAAPLAVNDSGIVYGTCGSNIFQYVVSSGQVTTSPMEVPQGYSSSTVAITTISPTGEVFGSISTNLGDQAFEYLYPNGPAIFVPGLAASNAYLPEITAANSSGELVGHTSTPFQYLDGGRAKQ